MPKAIIDSGYADSIVPLEKIATEINKAVIWAIWWKKHCLIL
jgi:chemotaxis response regulator CheB